MNALAQKPQQNVARRILVIDDDLDNARSLALLFQTMGHHVDYAINATAGVDMALSMKPDVIFLDILLPDDHGAAVCRELRGNPAFNKTRIYGVTGSSRMMDLQLALDAGCDDVLRKPVLADTYQRLALGGMHRRKLREFISNQRNEDAK